MEEIWKDIKNYEGYYQVSNTGKIKSLPRIYKCRHNKKEIIKKPSKLPKGYLRVGLSKEGQIKYYSIHRLVAEAFIPNPLNLSQVNHKDFNTSNNCVENLEWCDSRYNINYGNAQIRRMISRLIYEVNKSIGEDKEIIELANKIKERLKG